MRLKHTEKYFGTFTNKEGTSRSAFIQWRDDKKGFIIYDAKTDRPLVNTAFPTLKSLLLESGFTRNQAPVQEFSTVA